VLDELGLEPGATLQRFERQILNQDKQLDLPPGTQAAAAAAFGPTPSAAPAHVLERTRATVFVAGLATTDEAEEDPERTAALFERLHAEAAAEIEAAGGTAEKGFVGALLATFEATGPGEDDHPTVAARAAVAMRDRLTRTFGETLSFRIGLECGEIIVGRPGSLAAGRPVTAAAELVRLARPGEVVVGARRGEVQRRVRTALA
jgi:class 3 adenylate cyclase